MGMESDFEDAIESTSSMNPIKLKAMAMKLRHRKTGLMFVRKDSRNSLLSGTSKRSHNSDDGAPGCSGGSKKKTIEGPDNMLGLQTIFYHPFCIPLLCVPLGVMSALFEWSTACTFWLNFLALVPLAKILGDATEELAATLHSDTISGLLNATFGNAVEMIVSVQSLRAGLVSVVKASLLGSVLSNILLVLGTAFLLGGLAKSSTKRSRSHSYCGDDFDKHVLGMEKEQKFSIKGALVCMGMLLFACSACTLPTIFNAFPGDDEQQVLQVSRIGAWIVMSSYFAYLTFQLLTHRQTLEKDENKDPAANGGPLLVDGDAPWPSDEEDEEEVASLTPGCAIGLMFFSTLIVGMNSELLVDSIEDVVRTQHIPESFIGIILLPIAGNACEHASAVRFAIEDRPGLAISIAVGSSTQVALLVVPFAVLCGCVMDQPMDLDFGVLNVAVVSMSVLIVLVMILDGRSNWLKGYILCALYSFIAVLYWYTPAHVTGGTADFAEL